MSTESDTRDEKEDELDRLAESFVASARRGEKPSISEYARSHPDHAADIREIFPLLHAMEEIKTGAEGPIAGTRIGPYEIVREIGRGGMGLVYEAVQSELGRRVALKILPTQATLDPRFLDRFRLEAQSAARLEHPHIVPVIGYGNDDGLHYYSMQFIEGRGLDVVVGERAEQLAQPSGDRTAAAAARAWFDEAARLALRATEAIAHAHAHGVLHRDIKPSNLLLDRKDHIWITDFGLCREEGSDGLTATGDVLGTFRYMPPERFSGQSDVRGDVYGIGITLYELLTRRRAYEEESRPALAARILKESPKRPRALDARIPADLETIVRKAMAHEPAQRYATAEALAADLRAFLNGRPIAARAPTLGYLARSAIRRHKPLAATLAAALLVITVSSVLYVLDLKEKEARARLGQYAASIAAVESAIRARDMRRASGLLEEAPEEYRNWEWRHLRARLEPSLRKFESLPVRVKAAAYHPTGAWFAAAVGKQVWIYADDSGEVVRKLEPEATAECVRWSPDGTALAVGTGESLQIWSWPEGTRTYATETGETGGEEREVRWIDFTPDGRAIVCGVVQGRVEVHDAAGGGERSRKQVAARVLALDCADEPGSDRVVIGTATGRVTMLRRGDWQPLWSRQVSKGGVHAVAFVGGGLVACTTNEGLLRIWDADGGREVQTIAIGRYGGRFVRDPTGQRIMVFNEGRLQLYDRRTGTLLQTLTGGARPDRGAVHPEGRRIIVCSGDGLVREWYLGTGGDPLVLSGHMDDAVCADIGPRGRFAASGGFGGTVRLWDLEAGEQVRVFFGEAVVVTRVRFSPDGRWLASGDSNGAILVWDRATDQLHRRWQAHATDVLGLVFLEGGERLVSLGNDGFLRTWDTRGGTKQAEAVVCEALPRYVDTPMRLALGPNGRRLATGDPDGLIRLWKADDLRPLHDLPGHVKAVSGLAFHPTKRLLASVSRDQTLRLWDPEAGEEIRGSRMRNPTLSWAAGLNEIAFSPDGSRIATGSFSGTVGLWDTRDARLLATLQPGHWVTDVCFSPDGTRLLASLTNGSLRLWDSVPLRERVPEIERAAALRQKARPTFEEVARRFEVPEEQFAALAAQDVEPDVREAALRMAHQAAATHEGFVRRMWRDLTPADGDPAKQRVALALASGLWRATHHRERPDARCHTLLGVAFHRTGRHDRVQWVFDQIGRRNELRAPELFAIDLAFLSMSRAALDDAQGAGEAFDRLTAHLEKHPEVATSRVRAFRAEARAALDALPR